MSATIWNPPPMNVDNDTSAIASGTDVVHVVKPRVSDISAEEREPSDRTTVVRRVAVGRPSPEEVADAPRQWRNPRQLVDFRLREAKTVR